jgi:hypothetical protein
LARGPGARLVADAHGDCSGHTSTTPCATAHGVAEARATASSMSAASITANPATGKPDCMNGPAVVSTPASSWFRTCSGGSAMPTSAPFSRSHASWCERRPVLARRSGHTPRGLHIRSSQTSAFVTSLSWSEDYGYPLLKHAQPRTVAEGDAAIRSTCGVSWRSGLEPCKVAAAPRPPPPRAGSQTGPTWRRSRPPARRRA